MTSAIQPYWRNFIDGRWVDGSGRISVENPATAEPLAEIAQALVAGQAFINEWFAGGIETPFGGTKRSGYGREKGQEALLNYVQTKNIAIRLGRK